MPLLAGCLLANPSAGRAAPSPTGALTQRAQGASTMKKRPSAFSYDSKMNRFFFFLLFRRSHAHRQGCSATIHHAAEPVMPRWAPKGADGDAAPEGSPTF